jgi:hypothetical protein
MKTLLAILALTLSAAAAAEKPIRFDEIYDESPHTTWSDLNRGRDATWWYTSARPGNSSLELTFTIFETGECDHTRLRVSFLEDQVGREPGPVTTLQLRTDRRPVVEVNQVRTRMIRQQNTERELVHFDLVLPNEIVIYMGDELLVREIYADGTAGPTWKLYTTSALKKNMDEIHARCVSKRDEWR